jgi:ABC-type lipoprotein release transport system permease subunit
MARLTQQQRFELAERSKKTNFSISDFENKEQKTKKEKAKEKIITYLLLVMVMYFFIFGIVGNIKMIINWFN